MRAVDFIPLLNKKRQNYFVFIDISWRMCKRLNCLIGLIFKCWNSKFYLRAKFDPKWNWNRTLKFQFIKNSNARQILQTLLKHLRIITFQAKKFTIFSKNLQKYLSYTTGPILSGDDYHKCGPKRTNNSRCSTDPSGQGCPKTLNPIPVLSQ